MLKTRDQLINQQRKVFGAAAQWWHLDGEHIKAVIEILTKTTVFNQVFEISVRGSNDTYVTLDALVTTDSLERALLNDPQQLDLHGQWHVAYFIQEDRATLSQFESTLTGTYGTCEGTFLMTKKLTL